MLQFYVPEVLDVVQASSLVERLYPISVDVHFILQRQCS